jgi:hypothetical protein
MWITIMENAIKTIHNSIKQINKKYNIKIIKNKIWRAILE